MIEVYKIIYNIYGHENAPNLLRNKKLSKKLFTEIAKLNLRRNVFPIRVTEPRNSVSETVVSINSLQSLKTQLDKSLI